jgi:integrase/recombinase XerD
MNNNHFFTTYHTYLLIEKKVSLNTFDAYKRDLSQFEAFLTKQNLELHRVHLKDLKGFIKKLYGQKLSPRSLARKISSLKAFFNFLHERYELENVAADLTFPKLGKKLPRYLPERELQELLEVAEKDTSPAGVRNKVMVYLLYVSGMRVSELVGLKISDIHFDTGIIDVAGKEGKGRVVPVPLAMITLIKEHLKTPLKTHLQGNSKANKTEYLFPTIYGGKIKSITRQALFIILKRLWQQTTIKKSISPHTLRNSCATHLLNNGTDLRSLQILLGHENVSAVQKYAHVEVSHLRAIYDKKHPRS